MRSRVSRGGLVIGHILANMTTGLLTMTTGLVTVSAVDTKPPAARSIPMGTQPTAQLGSNPTRHPVLTLVAGPAVATLTVRPARPSDLPLLEAMVDRSSPDTLYRRFHGALGAGAKRELRRISRPSPRHRSWVAVGRGGVRGTATLAFGADGEAEIALFVEDDWIRHGVGRALADAVVREAAELGVREIV